MLRKSVSAFRDVIYDKSIAATVLDFELFQSVAPSTFENIRKLFSGQQGKQPGMGINVMYEHFHKHGYQTLFQEDLCWYDTSGTLLTDITTAKDAIPTEQRWSKFKNTTSKLHIDHFGLTHFSCEVFKQFGKTNPYEDPQKMCFNGRFFSSYFLRYMKDFANATRTARNAAPFISYMHISTAHTGNGRRCRNVDVELTDFISKMARDNLTWTIIMSDHGHRRTPFTFSTLQGEYERYNPLLFMIIPEQVAQILGKEAMNALHGNQKRLLTTVDLHRAFTSINDEDKRHSTDSKVSGVLSKIPWSRSCADVPLSSSVKCLCAASEEKSEDNSPKHQWMAEFALGTLNNEIQSQYSNGKKTILLGLPTLLQHRKN
ncbi:hypothetical protein QZH41_014430 [Actinostola sp. cb2023]|nr:hypothetical protein QZH41_014430 [Actinostola sp. cb2023]